MIRKIVAVGAFLLVSGCLSDVEFVNREPCETTVVIIRDGGNSSRDVDIFIDSLLVGATKESTATTLLVPCGEHYMIFDVEGHRSFGVIKTGENGIVYLRQSYVNAYVFLYLKTEPIDPVFGDSLMKCESLKKDTLAYYAAKKKMKSDDFYDCIRDTAAFKLRGPGSFDLRIRDTVDHR